MSSTKCPHCNNVMFNHGSIISKSIGYPLVTCNKCKQTIIDNNMYEWAAIPLESKLFYCLLANYRSIVHWFTICVSLGVLIEHPVYGMLVLFITESLICIALYWYVVTINSNAIQKSYSRIQNPEYINQLVKYSYDKLDLKLYTEHQARLKNAEESTTGNHTNIRNHDEYCVNEVNTTETSPGATPELNTSFIYEDEHIVQTSTNPQVLQDALDRWKTRKKSDWDLGIEYERYIGYLLEQKGYKVHYSGAILGLNDMGRDLVASKKETTLVIQCKRWSKDKTIHEKHIFQLHGSTAVLSAENPNITYKPVFITTTELSETARKSAQVCNISLVEQFPMSDYPLIKCNANNKGQRIYHLPFDPQYDMIIISKNNDSCYAYTIAEAEAKGFRRTYQGKNIRPREVSPKPQKFSQKTKRINNIRIPQKSSVKTNLSYNPENQHKSHSSFISSATYSSQGLLVSFTTGSTYLYYNVPEGVYEEMMNAPSRGKYFSQHIKDDYPYKSIQ